eukprot:SAG25_NODE_54_length_18691_cov_566.202076_7_plen_118_part_00
MAFNTRCTAPHKLCKRVFCRSLPKTKSKTNALMNKFGCESLSLPPSLCLSLSLSLSLCVCVCVCVCVLCMNTIACILWANSGCIRRLEALIDERFQTLDMRVKEIYETVRDFKADIR